jgi:putative transposase
VEEEMAARPAIREIAAEHRRRYRYRRIMRELRRRGIVVNHKRVLRILNEDNLLGVWRRAFVATTDCDHQFQGHLNLASRMELTGMNQLWVADITYIRLKQEFVIWRSCWTRSPARSRDGRWSARWRPVWR